MTLLVRGSILLRTMKSGVVEPNVTLTSNLEELRGKKSVSEVARDVGISRKAIYDLEAGTSAPDRSTLKALLAYYGTPIVFNIASLTTDKSN